jgi:ribosomal protein L37AE/L43A
VPNNYTSLTTTSLMSQPKAHSCPKCDEVCNIVSSDPLRIWKCPKCLRVYAPVTYLRTTHDALIGGD